MTVLRAAFVAAVAVAVSIAPVAAGAATGGGTTAQASLAVEIVTPQTGEPVDEVAAGGQPLLVRIAYSDLGAGTHEIELVEDDLLFDDALATTTVSGSSGTATITLSRDRVWSVLGGDLEPTWEVVARTGDLESATHRLDRVAQTTYLRGVPDRVAPNEAVTVTFYGWTDDATAPVYLDEDDDPLGGELVGEDEQIRYREVDVTDNYFEGTFTFTPSDYLGDEDDRVVEIQPRGANVFAMGRVANITVTR